MTYRHAFRVALLASATLLALLALASAGCDIFTGKGCGVPKVDAPKVDIPVPKLPKVDIPLPKVDIPVPKAPKIDIPLPKIDVPKSTGTVFTGGSSKAPDLIPTPPPIVKNTVPVPRPPPAVKIPDAPKVELPAIPTVVYNPPVVYTPPVFSAPQQVISAPQQVISAPPVVWKPADQAWKDTSRDATDAAEYVGDRAKEGIQAVFDFATGSLTSCGAVGGKWAVGGIAAYLAFLEQNAKDKLLSLPERVKVFAKKHYPNCDIDAVRYANSVNGTPKDTAVTVERHIYFPWEVNFETNACSMHWLLHELEHCEQYATRGGKAGYVRGRAGKPGEERVREGEGAARAVEDAVFFFLREREFRKKTKKTNRKKRPTLTETQVLQHVLH